MQWQRIALALSQLRPGVWRHQLVAILVLLLPHRLRLTSASLGSMASRVQQLQDQYRALESQRSSLIDSRRALGAQQSENEAVKAELAKLTPNNQARPVQAPRRSSTAGLQDGGASVDEARSRRSEGERRQATRVHRSRDVRVRLLSSSFRSTRVEAKLKETAEKSEQAKMELIKISTEQQAKREAAQGS